MDQIQFEKSKELYSRAVSTIQVQIGLSTLVFMYYLLVGKYNTGFIASYLLLFSTTFIRFFFSKRGLLLLPALKTTSEAKYHEKLFATLSSIYSITWSWFMIYPFLYLAVDNSQLIIFGFLSASVVASATTAMGISKRTFWAFSTPQFLALFFVYIHQFSDIYGVVLILITLTLFIYYFYKQLNVINRNWENFINQRLIQQKILDSFPGTVNLIEDGQIIYSNELFSQISTFKENAHLESFIAANVSTLNFEQDGHSHFEHSLDLLDKKNQTHLFKISKLTQHQTIIVGINVQEQKDKEQQIQEQKALLDQSSKMAALGEMSGGIAHEINNPLAVISLSSQKLKKDLSLVDFTDSAVRNKIDSSMIKIESMVSRISKIIKALRAFARDGSSDPVENVSIGHILDDTLIFCETKFANSEIQIIKEYDPTIEIKCRSTEISQVILNLLNNAYDAITSSTQKSKNKTLRISTLREQNKIKIFIQDSGDGITPSLRDKVMQPFFTTKDVGQGTGLGLSISRSIMKSHNGEIYFDFNDSTYTTVVLEFNI